MLNGRNVLLRMAVALLLTITFSGSSRWPQALGQGDTQRLALKGYDPVAYFTEGRPALGRPELEYIWDEARYRFGQARHMTLFRADPDRYLPQFAGSCAGGLSAGKKVHANPELWLIYDGRLFVFSTSQAQEGFRADPQGVAAAATANWAKLKDAPMGAKLSQ